LHDLDSYIGSDTRRAENDRRGHAMTFETRIERVCLSKYLPPQRLLFARLSWLKEIVFK
jgi:hypothetical protein